MKQLSLRLAFAIAVACAFGCADDQTAAPTHLVGAGAADITGPLVDVQFTGYSQPTHIANGIHTRLTARAFIFGELDTDSRLVFVVTDLLNVSQELWLAVVERLREKHGEQYSLDNVVISATHTHSSPGGYRHDGIYREAYFEAVVTGITAAIEQAHVRLAPGRVLVGRTKVEQAGANRSLVAYEQNPANERARYSSDTDDEMTLLELVTDEGVLGVLSWFAVHPTSLTFNNTLVSADHKGFAALEMETSLAERDDVAKPFVAAFAQSNCGDVTGNLNLDNTGPGVDDYDSARIIGQRQLDAAEDIFDSPSETRALSGTIDYRSTFVDFADLEVTAEMADGETRRTCFPAYGYSFAGGSTEDGAGHPLFREGLLERDESLDELVELVLAPPPITEELRACHAPKPILYRKAQQPPLPVGVARIGELAIAFVPAEVTTMAGRRMRDTIEGELGDDIENVIIAGYSNDYAGYITTPEEYAAQQYEGGHTLFGPWTLPAFRQELGRLAAAIAEGSPVSRSEQPVDLRGEVQSVPIGNEYDEAPATGTFGDISVTPRESYTAGETVTVAFWTGHPDNALQPNAPYLEIQRAGSQGWTTIATEADWDTRARWNQASRVIPPYDPLDPFAAPPPSINEAFTVHIEWHVPEGAVSGSHRIVFHGVHKETGENPRTFTSSSPTFEIE